MRERYFSPGVESAHVVPKKILKHCQGSAVPFIRMIFVGELCRWCPANGIRWVPSLVLSCFADDRESGYKVDVSEYAECSLLWEVPSFWCAVAGGGIAGGGVARTGGIGKAVGIHAGF